WLNSRSAIVGSGGKADDGFPARGSRRASDETHLRGHPSRCVPTSLLARLGWLAQFSETLAIASSALGSAHRLTAKRRTTFSPRAHYKLSIWCWAPRYSRWPRPHELGQLHDFYACLTRRYPSSLAIWLATADAACGGAEARCRNGLSATVAELGIKPMGLRRLPSVSTRQGLPS